MAFRTEPIALTEKTTLILERLPEGKIRVTSNAFNGEEKVILADQVLEVRMTGGRIRIARKPREGGES